MYDPDVYGNGMPAQLTVGADSRRTPGDERPEMARRLKIAGAGRSARR